jgi:hypothetical protein
VTRLLAVLILTLTAVAASTARAALADAPWSAPTAMPGVGGQGVPATITAAGNAVAVTPQGQGAAAPSQLVRLAADGTLRSTTPFNLAIAELAPYATDRFVVAGQTLGTATGTIDDTSKVQVGTATGAVGTPSLTTLSGATGMRVAGLSANKAGTIALVTANTKERQVWLRAAHTTTFKRVLTIKVSNKARDATIAVGISGDVLVVWEDNHHVYARHRGAHSWGATRRIGDGVQSNLQAAVDDQDRLLVAWKSQRVNEGEADSPAVVNFTTAAPGHNFGTARQIESVGAQGTGRYVSAPGVRLESAGGSRALLAWTGYDGAHYVVRAMNVTAGHRGTPQTLSPAGQDAVLGDVATTTFDGPQLVLWRSNVAGADALQNANPRVFAAVRKSPSDSFGAAEAISDPNTYVSVAPAALLDPSTGRALALYTQLQPSQDEVASRPAP